MLLDILVKRWLDYRTRQEIRKMDIADMEVKRVLLEGGNLDMMLKHPAFRVLAEGIADFYAELGGENFLELTMASQSGVFVITIAPRRPGVKTPGEIVRELKERLKEYEGA